MAETVEVCGHSGTPGRPQVVVRCISLRFACNLRFQGGSPNAKTQGRKEFPFKRNVSAS